MANVLPQSLTLLILTRLRSAENSALSERALFSELVDRYGSELPSWTIYYSRATGWPRSVPFDVPESFLRYLIQHELISLQAAGMVRPNSGDTWALDPNWFQERERRDEYAGGLADGPGGSDGTGNNGGGSGGGGDGRDGGGNLGDGPGGRGPGLGEVIAHPTLFALTREDLVDAVRNALGGDI